MGLIGAFNNGVSGLVASAQALGVVSQNMANIRTPGYRRVETEFATLLGGIEAKGREPGGVQAWTRQVLDSQGQIEATGGQFDLAIVGSGFFVFGEKAAAGNRDALYSRGGDLAPIFPAGSTDGVAYLGNASGYFLLGWPASNGTFPTTGAVSSLVPIPANSDDSFPGQATATGTLTAILPASGTSAGTQVFYIDAAGDRQTVNLSWTKTGPNAWDMQASDLGGAPLGGPAALTFDGYGALTSAPTVSIGGLFNLDLANLTQRGSAFIRGQYDQDGIARGEFIRYQISDDGTVNGYYSSGAIRPLYRIPVATFVNPNAMIESAGGMYRVSAESGDPTLKAAGGDDVRITAGALELANFDLSEGFTRLIVTQRAYDTAAQVVRTVDEMSQTARDMKR